MSLAGQKETRKGRRGWGETGVVGKLRDEEEHGCAPRGGRSETSKKKKGESSWEVESNGEEEMKLSSKKCSTEPAQGGSDNRFVGGGEQQWLKGKKKHCTGRRTGMERAWETAVG